MGIKANTPNQLIAAVLNEWASGMTSPEAEAEFVALFNSALEDNHFVIVNMEDYPTARLVEAIERLKTDLGDSVTITV